MKNFRLNELKLNFRDQQKIHHRRVFSSFPMLHTLYRNSPNQQNQQENQNLNQESEIKCIMDNLKKNNSDKLFSFFKTSNLIFVSIYIALRL